MVRRSKGSPSMSIGAAAPSAFPPSPSRRVKTLTKARNRCQATPIVNQVATTAIQVMEMRIFAAATILSPSSRLSVVAWASREPAHAVVGYLSLATATSSPCSARALSRACMVSTQTMTAAMTASTK